MMFTKFRGFPVMLLFVIFLSIDFSKNASLENGNNDPFAALGIPDLSPKKVMEEIDKKAEDPRNNKNVPQLKSMEDLPNFLKLSSINEEEGIKILTRFLIQDDFTLKKYGVVYDQTGFDGLGKEEVIAAIGTEERLNQRAKSSANIWFREKYPKLSYEAYGTEPQMDEIVPNWRVFKVLMIGGRGETTYLKICLPLDESETALVGDKDEPCMEKANFVDKEKEKNEDYISKIRTNNFFKKKKGANSLVKLLPGEKMIVKNKNKNIVLDSNLLKQQQQNNGFLNPPNVDSASNSAYALAIKNKKNRSMFTNNKQSPNTTNNQMEIQNNNGSMGGFTGNNGMPNNFSNFRGNMNMNQNQFMQNGMNMNNNFRFNQIPQGQQPMNNNMPMNNNNNNNFGNFRFNASGKNFQEEKKDNIGNSNNSVASNTGTPSIPPMNNGNPNEANNANMNLMNEFKQLKEQMMMLAEQIKQKDEIIKQQNSKLMATKIDPINMSQNTMNPNPMDQNQNQNMLNNVNNLNNNQIPNQNLPNKLTPENNVIPPDQNNLNGLPAAGVPNMLQNQDNMQKAMTPGFNPGINNMGMQMGMNPFGNGQFYNPMQYNNFMGQQMPGFNPNLMGNYGNNGMNQMMPNQMGQMNNMQNKMRKNLREVL